MINHILKSINFKALGFVILAQILLKYALFEPFANGKGLFTTLNFTDFTLLILSSFCIGAAGFIIYDLHKDNQLESSSNDANKKVDDAKFYTFMILTLLGIGLGYYLCYRINFTSLFSVFIVISVLIYVYASFLKLYPFVGNFTVSIIIGFAIFSVGLFDLIPVFSKDTIDTQTTFLSLTLDYSILIAFLNLLKSSVADFNSLDFDHKVGNNTLPIALGRERAKFILIGINTIIILLVIGYTTILLYKQILMVGYVLIFMVAPLIFCFIKLWNAKTNKDYRRVIFLLSLTMFTTILSLVLHPMILLPNA